MKKILIFGLLTTLFATTGLSQMEETTAYHSNHGYYYCDAHTPFKAHYTYGGNEMDAYGEYFCSRYVHGLLGLAGHLEEMAIGGGAGGSVEHTEEVTPENGTDEKYVKIMEANIRTVEKSKEVQEFLNVASTFERIAKAEKDKWLPQYYTAFCYTRAAFKTKDLNLIDEYGDRAVIALNAAAQLSPDNSEIKTLTGFLALSRIKVDFMQRGMKYSSMAMENLKEAIRLDPTNPRAYSILATCMFNLPPQVGGSEEKGCELNNTAMQFFAKEQAENEGFSIEPHWGIERSTYVDQNVCNPKKKEETADGK